MNKNLLYGALIIIVIIVFTLVWKNSQKDKVGDINTETPTTLSGETAATINEDVNNIEVDSGIDADLKAIDTDLGTL
ncbi:MAG: hypothetical protein WCW04_00455 [Candidatus Paceibacterota bacterium]